MSLCKKQETSCRWGVSAGLVGTEGVGGFIRGEPTDSLFPLFCLLFSDVGCGAPQSQARAYTSPGKFIKPYLHL